MKRNKVKRILSTATAMALTTTTLAGGMTVAASEGKVSFLSLFRQKAVTLSDCAALPALHRDKKDRLRAVRGRPFSVPVYFFSCCSCSLRSSRMRFFSLLTWGHGQLKPSLALHQRVSG